MKLVIAEKKSVAESIAAVLGANRRESGFFSGNNYIVSWCYGHLLGLAEPGAYNPEYAKWRLSSLPILPDKFRYIPNPGPKAANARAQLKILVELIKRPEVELVVNACDAGREGEYIFRLVFGHAGSKKPIERLWISSLEQSAISEGFNSLGKGADYDNLYSAALCRAQADWLVGMNFSRLVGEVYGIIGCSIGRVVTPTLAMIVEREAKISGFVKQPFYVVGLSDGRFSAEREKMGDKSAAEMVAAACEGKTATVNSVEQKEKSEPAPRLYDLTSLQQQANKLFGYPAKQTLDALQKLYEQKIVTYPRTDSRFITEDMAGGIPTLLRDVAEFLPFDVNTDNVSVNIPRIVNNAKVTDHHAIIPTPDLSKAYISALQTAERDILMMICTRLIAAVSERHIYAETVVTLDCGGEIFTAKGKTITQNGWKDIEQAFLQSLGKSQKVEDKPLPELSEGQELILTASVREGFTSPPKPYTEATLLSAMENAGAQDMPEDAERKGLGTPATRAETIETLLSKQYIRREGRQLIPTPQGIALIEVLPDGHTVKSPLLTAEWESELKKVERGELSREDFMKSVREYVAETVKNGKNIPTEKSHLAPTRQEVVGSCPSCKAAVTESKLAFSCEHNRDGNCKFILWKKSKYPPLQKKTITTSEAKQLISDGKVFMKGLYSTKKGRTYDATLVLSVGEDGKPDYRQEFGGKR